MTAREEQGYDTEGGRGRGMVKMILINLTYITIQSLLNEEVERLPAGLVRLVWLSLSLGFLYLDS